MGKGSPMGDHVFYRHTAKDAKSGSVATAESGTCAGLEEFGGFSMRLAP